MGEKRHSVQLHRHILPMHLFAPFMHANKPTVTEHPTYFSYLPSLFSRRYANQQVLRGATYIQSGLKRITVRI
ncbi:Uncharacterized protein APZ42_027459 [Daphnia magna]|uniref:Uncharacterized protein n=1 Tax=Daphnia magna TaxID=35525 RepID=A0A0N8CF55_9CRUS|nr:Uncharacterized protein APZ42_027459 [Daphnia magna]